MSPILRPFGRWPVLAAAIVLVVVAGGGVAWAKTRGSATAGSTTQYVAAKVATVNQTVAASGTIAAAEEADLDFGAAGRVTKVLVVTGDKVRNGQALARIGTAPLTAAYDAAKAQRESAVDTASEDSGDSSAQRSADAAQVTAATTAATEAKQALTAATLRSTIAGTVTSVDLTVGQQVSPSTASASSGTGTTTATSGRGDTTATPSTTTAATSSTGSQVVVQSAGKIVNGTVDDTDVQQVKPGQAVAITPDGATAPVSGVVQSVGSVPSSSSGVVTFPVVIRVTGHPTGVYAGASATMTITTKHVSNVLEIPTLAVTYAGSTASVEVQQGGSTVKRTVTIGATYGLESQVLSGVKSGEKVRVTIPTFGGRQGRSGGTGFGGGGGTGTGGGEFTNGGGGGFTNGGGFGGGGGG